MEVEKKNMERRHNEDHLLKSGQLWIHKTHWTWCDCDRRNTCNYVSVRRQVSVSSSYHLTTRGSRFLNVSFHLACAYPTTSPNSHCSLCLSSPPAVPHSLITTAVFNLAPIWVWSLFCTISLFGVFWPLPDRLRIASTLFSLSCWPCLCLLINTVAYGSWCLCLFVTVSKPKNNITGNKVNKRQQSSQFYWPSFLLNQFREQCLPLFI